ncbi:MAG: putative DNA binding domain-containing protein [Verrucomicrobia bacterium]|nr:putative DNA binding domain-containing protein [Verrucomicrobiota bacterium]
MNPKIDLSQLASRESEQVEWKKNVADIDNVLRTISAFANDFQNLGGGYVVCGAEEVKDEHGFPKVEFPGITSARFKEIENKVLADCRAKIDPELAPIVEELPGTEEGHRVLVFIVPASNNAHCYRASGKDASTYFVRVSRETIEARNGVLRELLVRKGAQEPWDRRPNSHATLADIDLLVFREVLQQTGSWNPSLGVDDYFEERMRLSALVPSLGARKMLDKEIRPRNFALILFGREPTRLFPGAFTKVSFYPGKDRSEPTSERKELFGSVVEQARNALDLLRTHSSTAFDKESAEPNAVKYPERALQEAVVNAIAHRDYEIDEPTSITIFADRVEIRSPGGLPRTVDRNKFLAGTASPSWRNQSLAYFLNKLQLAQAEGQGIPTILRTMKQLGSPDPMFELEESAVTCVLPAHPRHEMMRHVVEIARLLVQQDVEQAEAKLVPLLELNPASPQLLELLAQIAFTKQRPEWISTFISRHGLRPNDLPSGTVFQLAEALQQSLKPGDAELAKQWLQAVAQRSLQADEVRRVTVALRKIGRDEEAVQVISRFIGAAESPLAIPSALYDVRARAKIDLAKKCMDTGRGKNVAPPLRARAWDQCRCYLNEAESDIIKALESETHPREREYYEKDLEFVLMMQQQAKRPSERPHQQHRPRRIPPRRREDGMR